MEAYRRGYGLQTRRIVTAHTVVVSCSAANGSRTSSVNILETEHLIIRELRTNNDAEFVYELLNTPKFIKYIGDRGVRSTDDAAGFIENRYRVSYQNNGFGLYVAERKSDSTAVGLCGFVKRDTLPGPDIGFAFLPEFEGLGYGFESADAMMAYGRDTLGFTRVLAITSLDNEASARLLIKLGFTENGLTDADDGEKLRLFVSDM